MSTVFLIKVISALLYPLGFASMLILLALICRALQRNFSAKVLLVAGALVMVLSSNPIVARNLAFGLERQYPQLETSSIARHDAIIVLGGGLRIPLPPAKHVQLTSGSDRYWYAANLYISAKAEKIILSGGNVYKQSGFHGEAYYAAQLLEQWGVPASAIILESDSRTTQENFLHTQTIMRENGVQSALLVTSAIHMPRAYALFSDLPIRLTPASADVVVRFHSWPVVFRYIPSSSALDLTTKALHEYYGLLYVRLRSML